MSRNFGFGVFLKVLAVATVLVAVVKLFTNHMQPRWDMIYYLDMATHGLSDNHHLVAPFAYRPGAPLIIGAIAHVLHANPERVFHTCTYLACIGFVVSCFYFARALGATETSALSASIALALYFPVVKWNIFAGAMVDIYAYPLLLLAFWLLWTGRVYGCLLVSAIGLFFKEWLLLPLATQAAYLTIKNWRANRRALIMPLGLSLLILVFCFLLPRLLIHVAQTFQDIDPVNDASTLHRLLAYPESRRRDFNILFAYLSCWLPILLLLSRERWGLLSQRLKPHRTLLALYMLFQFVLVMYGGTNLTIFASYSLPVQIVVLVILLDQGRIPLWEQLLMLAVVIAFNRVWMQVPLPDRDVDAYLNFYGGFHKLVNARSFLRLGELAAYVLGFWFLRFLVQPRGGRKQCVDGVHANSQITSRETREATSRP